MITMTRSLSMLVLLLLAVTAPAQEVVIRVSESESSAPILPLLGVNAGPSPSGEPGNPDVTSAYREIGVDAVRTHDIYDRLDMAVMYPDRTKDPSDPASYDFTDSDEAFAAILNGGFEPYFRLGDSYNLIRPPRNASERANWVRAAVEVLRHYREGKWNGFTSEFRYVEIWNEPDGRHFWPEPLTEADYFALYSDAAVAIRDAFPSIRIGGPGLTPAGYLAPSGRAWTEAFLSSVSATGAPLDFISWHMYSNDPENFAAAARFYRDALDRHGLTSAESHISEWNTEARGNDGEGSNMELRTGMLGASILTAAWIRLQEERVDVSMFYRGNDTSMKLVTFYGMLYANGERKRIADAFSLWSRLVEYSHRLDLEIDGVTGTAASLVALAGRRADGSRAILLANPGPASIRVRLDTGLDDSTTIHRFVLNDEGVTHTAGHRPELDLAAEGVELVTWPGQRTRGVRR